MKFRCQIKLVNITSIIIIILLLLSLNGCISSFTPELKEYESIIVVDAMLTDQNEAAYVKLSYTLESADEEAEMISGATVSITDDLDNAVVLDEVSDGVYKTDSLTFRGVAGRTYILHIKTPDGKEYESDTITMHQPREIDSIYFEKDSRTTDDGEYQEGISIYIDSKAQNEEKYLKWKYEEWWKFTIPNPVLYDYYNQYDIRAVDYIKNATCYANNKSEDIIIQNLNSSGNQDLTKKDILFIASDKSNRLLKQYYVEISQYALTEQEYEFWQCKQEISDAGGDIFDNQPFELNGNMHCISNTDEKVLGYFMVCGESRKRICISESQIVALGLNEYNYECKIVTIGPSDYPDGEVTFDEIYDFYTSHGYNFIMPSYDESFQLESLVFAEDLCSDCTTSGSLNKPYFWVDVE